MNSLVYGASTPAQIRHTAQTVQSIGYLFNTMDEVEHAGFLRTSYSERKLYFLKLNTTGPMLNVKPGGLVLFSGGVV